MPADALAARTSSLAHGRYPRPAGRSPQGFPNWDAVTGDFRNDEGFNMEEAVVEREAIKEAAKAKRRERRLQLQAQKERTAEADRVASLYGNCCMLSR